MNTHIATHRTRPIIAGTVAAMLTLGVATATDAAFLDLATYSANGANDTARRAVTTFDSSLLSSAGSISNGTGFPSVSTLFREVGSSDYVILQRTASNQLTGDGTEAGAVAGDAYWSITLTPEADVSIDLVELAFDTLWFNASPGATMFVRTDAGGDSFTTTLGSFEITTSTRTARTIDLVASSVDFSDLTDPFTFRFYMYVQSGANASTAGMDNIVLRVIPEPGSLALLAAGSLLIAFRGRGHHFRGRGTAMHE